MLTHHREKPAINPDRYLVLAAALCPLPAAGWLLQRIFSDLDQKRTWEFLALALLAGLFLYLVALLLWLLTVSYTVTEDRLTLRQGLRRVEVPLSSGIRLHRWRWRWMWSGEARRDLGAEEVSLFPPVWLGRSSHVWVVTWRDARGEHRAVALRPSPALLGMLRGWQQEAGSAS